LRISSGVTSHAKVTCAAKGGLSHGSIPPSPTIAPSATVQPMLETSQPGSSSTGPTGAAPNSSVTVCAPANVARANHTATALRIFGSRSTSSPLERPMPAAQKKVSGTFFGHGPA